MAGSFSPISQPTFDITLALRPRVRVLSEAKRKLDFLSPGDATMTDKLSVLIEMAKAIRMTPGDQEEQRRSFAFGNTKIENDLITSEMVDQAAEDLKRAKGE
jgi:hypothetical protein